MEKYLGKTLAFSFDHSFHPIACWAILFSPNDKNLFSIYSSLVKGEYPPTPLKIQMQNKISYFSFLQTANISLYFIF